MRDEGGNNQPEAKLFREVEVAVEECTESDEDLEAELRDVADEDLFEHLEQMKSEKQQ